MAMKIRLKALLSRRRHRYHKLYRSKQGQQRSNNLLHRLCHKFKSLSCASSPPNLASKGPIKSPIKKPLPPPDVRRGSCAVYVGPEHKRFVLKTCYLQHPAFEPLLQRSEEEFDFAYGGGILIPCPVAVFEYLLRLLKRKDSWIGRDDVTEMILRAESPPLEKR